MPQIRKVLHVELLELNNGNKRHLYFGSKAAIFQHLSPEQLGVTYKTLRNFGDLTEMPYSNKKCIIRQGELIASSNGKENKK